MKQFFATLIEDGVANFQERPTPTNAIVREESDRYLIFLAHTERQSEREAPQKAPRLRSRPKQLAFPLFNVTSGRARFPGERQ